MNFLERAINLRSNVELDMERYLEDGYDVLDLASVYATQALFLYRQIFSDEDYELMIKTMYENRMSVKKIPIERLLKP